MDNQEFLDESIRNLPVSENFYLRSELMGFKTIQEILTKPTLSLLADQRFSYAWLGELVRLLISNNMLDRLQPTPGSSAFLAG